MFPVSYAAPMRQCNSNTQKPYLHLGMQRAQKLRMEMIEQCLCVGAKHCKSVTIARLQSEQLRNR